MSKAVIKASGLSKEYLIGARERRKETFREMLMSAAAAPFKRFGRLSGRAPAEDRIWALKDVSFEVQEGEIVGLIGRNGAGKSTLLKMLSRITTPTEGRAEIRGRVGSLLEVGTGFHPELTGRENVYLNGAILGMSREEIRKKFDEIVDFAGIEAFLDTPVKRYSSGMAVRLAFAVAAHLETEVLLVDEVLAVGDADFQRKCLGKMSDVAHSGRTIIFVSHNMAAVENLCTRGVLLEQGRLKLDGGTTEVLRIYAKSDAGASADINTTEHAGRSAGAQKLIRRFRMLDENGRPSQQFGMGEQVVFALELEVEHKDPRLAAAIHIYNLLGQRVLSFNSRYQMDTPVDFHGRFSMQCRVPYLNLLPGAYRISASVVTSRATDRIEFFTSLEMLPKDVFGTGRVPPSRDGVFFCRAEWDVERPSTFAEGERSASELGELATSLHEGAHK